MFTVTCDKKHGVLWDAKANKPLIKFVKGKAETDDEAVAKKLLDMGYSVEGEFTSDNPFSKMTVEELKAYAAEKSIDLGDATKKKDIVAKIQEADNE